MKICSRRTQAFSALLGRADEITVSSPGPEQSEDESREVGGRDQET